MVTILVMIKIFEPILFIWKRKTNSLWHCLHQLRSRKEGRKYTACWKRQTFQNVSRGNIQSPKKRFGVTRQYARLGCKCFGPDMSASRWDSTSHFGQVRGYFPSNRESCNWMQRKPIYTGSVSYRHLSICFNVRLDCVQWQADVGLKTAHTTSIT